MCPKAFFARIYQSTYTLDVYNMRYGKLLVVDIISHSKIEIFRDNVISMGVTLFLSVS